MNILARYLDNLIRKLSKRHDRKLLCHECAKHDSAAFNRLIYGVRGTHQCQACGHSFTVTFTPA